MPEAMTATSRRTVIAKRARRTQVGPPARAPDLSGRQGAIEFRKDRGMAPYVIYGHEAPAEPDRSDPSRHLFADARRFFLVADELIGAAVDRAHSAPLGSRGVAPVDRLTLRVASQDAPCPMVRIGNECAGLDQHLLLDGRGHVRLASLGTRLGLAADQHGDSAQREYAHRLAAEQDARKAAAPVRRHDDEIALLA